VAGSTSNEDALAGLLAGSTAEVRDLALRTRALIHEAVPDAVEEIDPADRLVGFTFIPGTIKGLIVAIALQRSYVNLMFSKGVELMEIDSAGLLEGTGKKARHIKVRSAAVLDQPQVRVLIEQAAARTPR
jgi:hypothetical protein